MQIAHAGNACTTQFLLLTLIWIFWGILQGWGREVLDLNKWKTAFCLCWKWKGSEKIFLVLVQNNENEAHSFSICSFFLFLLILWYSSTFQKEKTHTIFLKGGRQRNSFLSEKNKELRGNLVLRLRMCIVFKAGIFHYYVWDTAWSWHNHTAFWMVWHFHK